MQRTYSALTGEEIAVAVAKKAVELTRQIPGLNSRLTVYPMARITITVKIEAFDRQPAEITDTDDLIERLVAEQIAAGEPTGLVSLGQTEHVGVIDEGDSSTDEIRRDVGLPVTRPTLLDSGQIVDKVGEPDPLPAKENLSNIKPFGLNTGRVIDQETVGLGGASPIREKLKGDSSASHFRVRQP